MENNKTGTATKVLAVIGFLAIIAMIAWISVRMVNLAPDAFSSLASLSESMNRESVEIITDQPESLTVVSDSNVINSNDEITISWDKSVLSGAYIFNYDCQDGITLDQVENNGLQRSLSCNTSHNVGDVDEINLMVSSLQDRFANVAYTVSFIADNEVETKASGNSSFTVINPTIDDLVIEEITPTEEPEIVEPEETEEVVVEEPEPTPTPVVVPPPTVTTEVVYAIPTSDPSGRTDLAVKFLNSGNILGSTFIPGVIRQDTDGAIQFEVKNLGTKTSDEWTFELTLPNGTDFESDDQEPLKPNERAVITIGFPAGDDDNYIFRVDIDEDTDQSPLNDRFIQNVLFVE